MSSLTASKCAVEVLTAPGQRRVIRRPKSEFHQREERREKTLCLTEWQMEEKAKREGGFDREVRVVSLRAPRARSVRCPGGDGRRRQPDGDVASTHQRAIIRGPVLDVVLRLVRRMDSRLHPSSLVCLLKTSHRIRAPTPRERQMRRFKSVGHAQRFLSVHGLVLNLFRVGRHLLRAGHHRVLRARSSCVWDAVTCAC